MKNEILIKTEKPDCHELWNCFLTTGWNEEYKLTEAEYSDTVIKSKFVVSAYKDEKLAGFGRVMADGIVHAMIYDLIVFPEFQGCGAGTLILEKLIALCKNEGIRDIQLFSARGKKEFYEKRGFSPRPDDAPGMVFSQKS